MIPGSNFGYMYARIVGENALLSMAQSNLLANLDRISKIRTHTFLANNGQTEHGISRNYGHERYYSWEDTMIDCRNTPTLVESDVLNDFQDVLAENQKFKLFKQDIEDRSGDIIHIEPFISILRGEDNMRYNIRRSRKVEDFDIIRVGICLSAGNDEDFDLGMRKIAEFEDPFKAIKAQPTQA